MEYTKIKLPQLAWYGNTQFEIQVPSSWQVAVCPMKGHNAPPLSGEQIARALAEPVGCPRLSELAKGKREVAILFDDMSRPTRPTDVLPYLLEELAAAGIKDGGIRFISAIGAHGALTRIDFAKKLGEDVLERFPVFNHNPYENCTPIGNTSQGTPVSINSEFMGCDLKIGIGSILPHPLTGFAGGGKVVLPGVASVDTIVFNHGVLTAQALAAGTPGRTGVGTYEENVINRDIAEATKMAGLDFKIDFIINARGETAGLCTGEPSAAYPEGIKAARRAYATEPVEAPDIVILNAYCKASESLLALPIATELFRKRRGDAVLIANAPEGQVTHYIARSFGKNLGGRLWYPRGLPENVNRLFLLSTYADVSGTDWLAAPEHVVRASEWTEVLDRLLEIHGTRARVAVIPDATMQYLAP